MKTKDFNEFFFYNPDIKDDHADFTDNKAFNAKQRMDFLQHYADFNEKTYNIPGKPQKVVSNEEIEKIFNELNLNAENNSNIIKFSKMDASLCDKNQAYRDWQLYTSKLSVNNDTLEFKGNEVSPTPAAVYFFNGEKRLSSFEFKFLMKKEYFTELSTILDTTPGRTVELRNGIEDIVKLQFYTNGVVMARCNDKCPYHLHNIEVGHYEFDKWQTIKIEIKEKDFSVSLNGENSKTFPLSSLMNPNLLYIGSGMFQVGNWCFKPVEMVCEDKIIKEFFVTADKACNCNIEKLGEVELPFAVGGFENHDKQIIFEKEFEYRECTEAELYVSTLDPGGEVFINNQKIYETDGFESFTLPIKKYLRKNKNVLKIIVYPRAPEVLFCWHRQKDPYNGWFCGDVNIRFINFAIAENIKVLPLHVEDDNVKCKINADFTNNCNVKLLLRKIYPEYETEEREIGSFAVENHRLDTIIEFGAELWSLEKPNLYNVSFVILDENGKEADRVEVETGFRTIEQSNGRLYLNGKPIILKGALLMQFLPPHSETSVTHICPRTEQIIWQLQMAKKMNSNTVRLHILGYGTNDERYARIADRLGIMLIWTTRYIDSVEQMAIQKEWSAKSGYIKQITERINNPSIIMWEGSNEFHPTLADIDRIYKSFVPAVKDADETRLISPISHLYYAGDIAPSENYSFYNDSGTKDYKGDAATASAEWNDSQVVRSAHTYVILLGYGTSWKNMREQSWSMQKELCDSQEHAYIVSEFAVIGRQNPNVPEAEEYFNHYSYEFPDENVLELSLTENNWRESQAYQALAAKADVQIMRLNNIDGMLWCCLLGGANDGGYLKPPIDCYGYPKMAFYTLQEAFGDIYVCTDNVDAIKTQKWSVKPILYRTAATEKYSVTATIKNEKFEIIEQYTYDDIIGNGEYVKLPEWRPNIKEKGYYSLNFKVIKK